MKYPSDPLIPHPIPITAWCTLGADIFCLDKKIYSSVLDYHSKFPLIKELPDNSAHSLKESFNFVKCWTSKAKEHLAIITAAMARLRIVSS